MTESMKPTPVPTVPEGAPLPRIPLPPNTGANPFDEVGQRLVREANDRAAQRDSTPFRERDPFQLDPAHPDWFSEKRKK